jgi:hypothetical protein
MPQRRWIVAALSLMGAVACTEDTTAVDAEGPGRVDAASAADARPADASAADAGLTSDATLDDASAADAAATDGGSVSSTRALTMREVSVLFPLPPAGGLDGLLAADAMGVGGPLVPALIYEQLPQLLLSVSAEVLYGQLRVIAARLDPCANRLTNQPCQAEVRLVLQPLTVDGEATSAADAAIHAIYGVDAGEFARFLASMRALGDGAPELARGHGLGVHPVMAREGLDGAYARGLRALLLSAVGEGRLRRLTFMQLSGRANVWIFGGFDRSSAGVYSPTRIPGVDTPTRNRPGHRGQACPSTSYTRDKSLAHASRYGTRSVGSNRCVPNHRPCTATRPTGTTFGRSRAAGASTPNARTWC